MKWNIDYNDLGKRIRRARKESGITQEKLAEMVGVGTTHISHIERGKNIPSVKILVYIMNSLQLSPNELFCGNVSTAAPNLLKETEEILEGCTTDEIKKLNMGLKMMRDWSDYKP